MSGTIISGLEVQDIGGGWRPRDPYLEIVEAEDWLVPFIGHRNYLDYIRRNGYATPSVKGIAFYRASKTRGLVGNPIALTSAHPALLAYTQDDVPESKNGNFPKLSPIFVSGIIQHYIFGSVAEIFGTDYNFVPKYHPNGTFYPNTLKGNSQGSKLPVAGYVALPLNAILNPNDIIVHNPVETSIRYLKKSTRRDYPTLTGGTICHENGYGRGTITMLCVIKSALERSQIKHTLCRPEVAYALSWTAYRKVVGRCIKIQLMRMEDFREHINFFEKFLGLGKLKNAIELPSAPVLASDTLDVSFSTSFEKAHAKYANGLDQLPVEAMEEEEDEEDPFGVFVPSKEVASVSKVIARLAPNDGFRAPLPLP